MRPIPAPLLTPPVRSFPLWILTLLTFSRLLEHLMRVMVTAAAGTSDHARDSRTAGHTPSTVPTSADKAAWNLVKSLAQLEVPTGLPRALRALSHEAVVTEDDPHLRSGWSQQGDRVPASSLTAVPQACHSQQS
jgi:hypothetical protein